MSTRTFPFEGWFLFSYLRVMFIPNSAHSNQNVSEKDGKFLSKNHRAKCKNHLRGVCEQTKELSVEFWSKLGPCKSSNPSLPTSDVPPDYNQFHHIEKEPATRPNNQNSGQSPQRNPSPRTLRFIAHVCQRCAGLCASRRFDI